MKKFLDAALNGAAAYTGYAYFFKGAKYYRYDWDADKGDDGYPLGLDEWGFPAPFDKGVDAALEGRFAYEKKAYFFKDDKYLAYDWVADKVDSGYPKGIVDEWGVPKEFFTGKPKIDAAVNGAGDYARYCYLFSGPKWIQIDWKDEEPTKSGTLDKDWGLPPEIAKGMDTALSGWGKKYGNKAYFFSDKKYSRYDWDKGCDLKNEDLAAWKIAWAGALPVIACKTPGTVCSIEADRFGKDGPKDPSTETKTAKGEDGIFFHGLKLGGCCDAHRLLKHTRIPDLIAIGGGNAFGPALDNRWLQYAGVGGYSAGRKPMIRYVQNYGDDLKYAFVLDPSWLDKTDYGATILKPWITGGDKRRLLVIYGVASAGPVIEEWIGALRGLDEDVRKKRIVVWETKEQHGAMVKHIPAMEKPSYKPEGGKLDKDFGEAFR
jgi:Hemopexin